MEKRPRTGRVARARAALSHSGPMAASSGQTARAGRQRSAARAQGYANIFCSDVHQTVDRRGLPCGEGGPGSRTTTPPQVVGTHTVLYRRNSSMVIDLSITRAVRRPRQPRELLPNSLTCRKWLRCLSSAPAPRCRSGMNWSASGTRG
eukprot:gene2835-biopygen5103